MLAQAGNWSPSNANLAYPRTLLKATDLLSVLASLNAPTGWYLPMPLDRCAGPAAH
jgi:hypothetical protein